MSPQCDIVALVIFGHNGCNIGGEARKSSEIKNNVKT